MGRVFIYINIITIVHRADKRRRCGHGPGLFARLNWEFCVSGVSSIECLRKVEGVRVHVSIIAFLFLILLTTHTS